jgi:hypothetical protein
MREELTTMYDLIEDIIIGVKFFIVVVVLGAIIAVAFAILLGLHGCATATLPQGSTPDQVNAAMCADAQMGYAVSSAWLETVKNPNAAENNYWTAYRAAAAVALQTYCLRP